MMNALVRLALRLYPRRWLDERGEELEQLVTDLLDAGDRKVLSVAASLALSGTRERMRRKYWTRQRLLVSGISTASLALTGALLVLFISAGHAASTTGDGVDLSAYTFDLDQQGQVVGVTPKADLASQGATIVMPDVLGLPLDEAQSDLRNLGVDPIVVGSSGQVVVETPHAGTRLDRGQTVELSSQVGSLPKVPYRAPTAADQAAVSMRLIVPVYSLDLTTLVGHMYPGKGFVPVGESPSSVPDIPTSTGYGVPPISTTP